MKFKKAFEFYKKNIRSNINNRVALCRIDLLFFNHILNEIYTKDNGIKIKKISFLKNYIANLILAIYSIINIFILKFKKLNLAHYMIDINNSSDLYDFRSKWILDIISLDNTINFMHINNIKHSLKTLFKKKNVIYFESIYFVLKPFLKKVGYYYKKTDDEKANNFLEISQIYYNDSYYIKKIIEKILKFLNIKKFIMLDDSRYTNELKLACNELNIKTIGYMHGRFNKYHLGIFEFPFDVYMVWSEYFKNMLLTNDCYKDKEIVVIGNPKLNKKVDFIKRGKNILWLGESNIRYEEILPYISTMKKLGYVLIYRGKPGVLNFKIEHFLQKNNIQKDKQKNFFDSLIKNNIGLVVGTHSTALMESWLVGVPSIALKCSYDYGSHLWEDGLIGLADKENLKHIIELNMRMTKYEIERRLYKIWGKNYLYNKEKVKKILEE